MILAIIGAKGSLTRDGIPYHFQVGDLLAPTSMEVARCTIVSCSRTRSEFLVQMAARTQCVEEVLSTMVTILHIETFVTYDLIPSVF